MNAEIAVYKDQLFKIEAALSQTSDGPDKDILEKLKSDLIELISLTEETNSGEASDPLSAEYELFKAEVESFSESTDKLKTDIDSLQGMKCQAPFKHTWTDQVVYHNALVFHVDQTDRDLKVKVMFTNPTHLNMLPCSYFLEGECKFDDEKCRFSHGEVVSFESLKEYKDPDFSNLSSGSRVLCKQSDRLWYRGIIKSIENDMCVVQLESSAKSEETHLENIQPLDQSDDSSSSNDDSDSDEKDFLTQEEIVFKIFQSPITSALGQWEQHTKGFGSRIMAKMGYIHGAGLGRKSEGRVEPVSAVIYPPGKSLDHCMKLKEEAGNDDDLFKAEKKLRRHQHKHEQKLKRAYEREKEKSDMFTVLNEQLASTPSTSTSNNLINKELKSETQRGLNVTSLKLSEDMKKIRKEIKDLHDRLARHDKASPIASTIKDKLKAEENKLHQLQVSERKISNELQQRKERKKLSIF